jgi:ERF superfamily
VQHSSDSVAALAAALAKAQARLVNPEKSLTATIRTGRMGETERTFRYAPLSSGLEIVRKTLSEHEIAVIQTTALDASSRILNLTTMLAHASGEWIASHWPVCPLADIASPHRMGAALTYARRYALFTLVGIAGEDDLDAPDLCTPAPSVSPPVTGVQVPARSSGNGRMRGPARAANSTILPAEQSAALRDRLVGEIAGFQSQDRAAVWAKEALPLKNTLTAADARLVETAFALSQSAFSLSDAHEPPRQDLFQTTAVAETTAAAAPNPAAKPVGTTESADAHEPGRIDKSVLTVSTPRRYRNKEHLRFVAQQPCLLCARKPSDPHHPRFVQPRALGRKASDEFAVPLCRSHHRAVHRAGNEQAWWKAAGIDPLKMARKLWKLTRMHEPRITSAAPMQDAAAERPAASDRQGPGRPTTA